VTRNSGDFAPICRSWAEGGRDHAGVMLIWTLSHRQYGEIIGGIEHWTEQMPEASSWRGAVVAISSRSPVSAASTSRGSVPVS
jgi:hypothetical protein